MLEHPSGSRPAPDRTTSPPLDPTPASTPYCVGCPNPGSDPALNHGTSAGCRCWQDWRDVHRIHHLGGLRLRGTRVRACQGKTSHPDREQKRLRIVGERRPERGSGQDHSCQRPAAGTSHWCRLRRVQRAEPSEQSRTGGDANDTSHGRGAQTERANRTTGCHGRTAQAGGRPLRGSGALPVEPQVAPGGAHS